MKEHIEINGEQVPLVESDTPISALGHITAMTLGSASIAGLISEEAMLKIATKLDELWRRYLSAIAAGEGGRDKPVIMDFSFTPTEGERNPAVVPTPTHRTNGGAQ